MNNLKSNKGFTLIELIVSIAILALLATAVIGILNSNTVIFRKSKADLSVQNTAQETYQKLSEEIMQAKYVYIEGYTSSGDVKFPTNEVGSETDISFVPVKLLRQSDINFINLAKSTSIDNYISTISSESTAQAEYDRLSDDNKKKFNTFYNSLRFMKEYELKEYNSFLNTVNGLSTDADSYTAFDDTSLVTSVDLPSGGTDVTYGKVYVNKIIIQYAVPFDAEYGDRADLLDPGNIDKFPSNQNDPGNDKYRKDYCRVTYEFYKNEMKVTYKYGAMKKLDTVVTGDSDVFSKSLNYVNTKSGTSPATVPGVICYIDGSKDVIGLDMYFAERSMSYTDNGMIYMRNSYVLHDVK